MISNHNFVADDKVIELFSEVTKRDREELLRLFRSLANNPYQKGERLQRAKSGREFQIKRFGKWLVTYWVDEAVLELRVVDVKKVVL